MSDTNFNDGPWGTELRSIRSERPLLAKSGARAKTFGAGLEQAEQLWRASAAVGPVASPLLLFYGLTQAGRAMTAAGGDSNGWRPKTIHGLEFQFAVPGDGAKTDLSSVGVLPRGHGLAQQVAELLDSPVLEGSTTLAALIASLDSDFRFKAEQLPGPRPLEVHQYVATIRAVEEPAFQSLLIRPVPEAFAVVRQHIPAGPNNLEHERIVPPDPGMVAEWLSGYPTLAALGAPTEILGPEPDFFSGVLDGWQIKLTWDDGRPIPDQRQSDWTVQHLDEVHCYDYSNTSGVVLPAVGTNKRAQDLLVAWWLVLYCLSMLARYYPKEWSEMLDLDASQIAVPLEHLISVGRNRVPDLIARRLRVIRFMQDQSKSD